MADPRRLLPGLARLRTYDRSWLRPDLVAGLTVGALLVPQAMAYAELAGLPAVAGLYAAFAPMVVYALVGSSRQLMVGPESTTAVMTAAALAPLAAGDAGRYVALAAALALMVGAICIIAATARLGFVSAFLSKPVLVGYLAGVAFIMIQSQLGRLTGVDIDADAFFPAVAEFARDIGEVHGPTLCVGLGVLLSLFVVQARWPTAPGPLLAVGVSTVAVALLGLDNDVRVVGDIPGGLPSPALPGVGWDDMVDLVPAAAAIALVGYTDNILTARSFATKNRYEVDPNQELLALGSVNVTSGFFQGFPISSSGSRTSVGDAAGSRSNVAMLVAAGMLLSVLLIFRPALTKFPQAALAAIIVFAAVRLIDLNALRRLARVSSFELVLALVTAVGVLAFDILAGILIAVGLSLIAVLARAARPYGAILGKVDDIEGYHDITRHPGAHLEPGLIVYRFDAPLFFLNAHHLRENVREIVDEAPFRVEWLLLDAEAMTGADSSAVETLEQVHDDLADRGVTLALARVKSPLYDVLERTGLVDRIGADRFFPAVRAGLVAFRARPNV